MRELNKKNKWDDIYIYMRWWYEENYVKELVEMNLLGDIFGSLLSMITNWKNRKTSNSFQAQFSYSIFHTALFSLTEESKSIHMY